MSIKTAFVFAAGFGTRMGSLTRKTPKPLLDLHGRPMIDHCLELLIGAGVERLYANTHYLPEQLEEHLAKKGVTTLREVEILETGGGLKAALSTIGTDPVITMNPDVLWRGSNPVDSLLAAWRSDMRGLLMLTDAGRQDDDFSLEHRRIQRKGPLRYTGLQIIRTDLLKDIPKTKFSLNEYWDLLLATGDLHGTVYDGKWVDIGTEEALAAANAEGGDG